MKVPTLARRELSIPSHAARDRPRTPFMAISFNTNRLTNERENDHMSTNLRAVLQELLQNTSNLKVLNQLMTSPATGSYA